LQRYEKESGTEVRNEEEEMGDDDEDYKEEELD
jgi:hypothetical protein